METTAAEAIRPEEEIIDWKSAHAELVRLAAIHASLDWDEGRWLVAALRFGSHLKLGFGSFVEYVERIFGYGPRLTQEKLRVAEALEALPELDASLRDGVLSWSAVRELTRVATQTTEKRWIAAARGRTVRDVERLVSGRKPGDNPDDPARPEAKRHTLRFDVSAEVLATFRDAMAKLRRDTGGKLDDDEALLLMARHVLGGPTDLGRSSYQVSVTVCPDCRRSHQHGSGESTEVGPEVVEMARCDAQDLGETHVGQTPARATQSVPPAVRRRVVERDGRRCSVPGCRHAQYLDLHHVNPRAEGGDHDPENLATLCGVHHHAAHRGLLIVTGTYSQNFQFRHADGKPYGAEVVSPEECELRHKVFLGLRGLGFHDSEIRRALAKVADAHVGPPMTAQMMLRKALDVLTARLGR